MAGLEFSLITTKTTTIAMTTTTAPEMMKHPIADLTASLRGPLGGDPLPLAARALLWFCWLYPWALLSMP